MRNPAQDLSPRTANSYTNTNTPPQASRSPLGGDGFEGPLPSTVLDELLRRRRVTKTPRQRQIPPWLVIGAIEPKTREEIALDAKIDQLYDDFDKAKDALDTAVEERDGPEQPDTPDYP
jgi:hypothetical protein